MDRYNLKKPVQLVADIEGAEHDLIVNDTQALCNNVFLIIVEIHEFAAYDIDEYNRILVAEGFRLVEKLDNTYVYENESKWS
jgi:hypothetical protein